MMSYYENNNNENWHYNGALVFGLMVTPAMFNDADAKLARPDISIQCSSSAPSGDTSFGGEIVGKYHISVRGDIISIMTSVTFTSSEDTVYEGWLVDVDSGEKTSIGIFDERGQGIKAYLHTNIQTDFDNDLIVITEEPVVDTDPAPHTPVGGAVLGPSFGQSFYVMYKNCSYSFIFFLF